MRRFSVGDEFEGVVSDFGMSGEGIVKDGAYPVFVPFAIVGERVRVRIVHAKKDYAFGELIEVLTASNDRIKPACRHFGRCGGCDLQHLSHAMQEEVKRLNLERTLAKSGIEYGVPEPVCAGEWAYRNKLSLPFGRMGRRGKIVLGFYEKKSHRVVPLGDCPLHGEWAGQVIADVTDWANECGLSVYDETTGKGLLRHIAARFITTLSLAVVVNGDEIPHAGNLYDKLSKHFGDVALYVSPNKARTNVIFGDTVRLVKGKEREQRLGSFSATVSPLSFLQVNDAVRDMIYADVCAALADFAGNVTELYSGVGILTAELALRLPEAAFTAVEIVPEAVRDAEKLMKKLGLADRVTEVCADAAEYMRSLPADGAPRALVLDPPRKGCDESVLAAAAEAAYSRIVYISCNPATLARDLKFLLSRGYTITSLRPYDMFPQTMHVETLAVLERNGSRGSTPTEKPKRDADGREMS